MYVRVIEAVLSLYILFIVSSFFILCFFDFMFVKHNESTLFHLGGFGLLPLSLFCSLFSGLSSTIVAYMICIIKSGIYKDGFNVIYTRGVAYCCPSWCTLSISFITSLFVGIIWLDHWRGAQGGALAFVEKKTVVVEADAGATSDGSSEVSKERVTTPEPKI